MRRAGKRALVLAALGAMVWAAVPAAAHIVYGRPTLLSLVGGAELVAHARVLDPDASIRVGDAGERRPAVRVELREVIKGAGKVGDALEFASHGHGVATYAKGEEILVFLVPLERSPELSALRGSGLRWVSFQEHDARFLLEGDSRPGLLAATRRYAKAGQLPNAPARAEAIRRITFDLLTSGDARLGASALQDLVRAGELPLVSAADVPRLKTRVILNPKAPVGVRIGLLAELGRRGLLEAAPLWSKLLDTTSPPELLQVVRAAGRYPGPELSARLTAMLCADAALAEAAALALGEPRHASAVPALAAALQRDDARVRMAAVRALGRIATPKARAALQTAAATHDDGATRRRAAAELRRLGGVATRSDNA